jgi:hypothetical protein
VATCACSPTARRCASARSPSPRTGRPATRPAAPRGRGARARARAASTVVYADSQTPVSADGFSFTRGTAYPAALRDFARGHATLERLRCDLLVTPHPSASALWERVAARDAAAAAAGPSLVDAEGCRRYAAAARAQLARRVATERAAR